MSKILCDKCLGNGRMMGLGGMQQECRKCEGIGYTRGDAPKTENASTKKAPKISDKIDKRSAAYKSGVKAIMDRANVSKKEAEKLFDESLTEEK